jgi:hypothetical protein
VSPERLRPARLVALFLLGWLGFNTPLLRLASRDVWVAGLPLTWIYLFGVWTLLIALLAMALRPPRRE